MKQERTNGGVAVTVTVVLVLLVALPVLYVLSIGPAAWLHEKGYLKEPIEVIYAPLETLAISCEPVEAVLRPYVELWRP